MTKDRELHRMSQKVKSLDEIKARNAIFQKKRLEKGYSIRKLAELTGISASYISKLENGYSLPSIEVVQKLSDVLGVEVESDIFSKKNLSLRNLLTEYPYHIDNHHLNRTERHFLADIMEEIWYIVEGEKEEQGEADFARLEEQINLLKKMRMLNSKKEEL